MPDSHKFPPSILNPTNLLSDADIPSSNEESSSNEEASSTEMNDTKNENNLNRRVNIDGDPSPNLFECNNSVSSRTGIISNTQQLNQKNLKVQPQISQFRRTNTGKNMSHREINSIPLRRLPYHPHQTMKDN